MWTQGGNRGHVCPFADLQHQVVQRGDAVFHKLREIRDAFFLRQTGDIAGETADVIFRLQQPGVAADFRRGAGGLHPGSAGADDDHVRFAINAPRFVGIAVNDVRVN